jgi:hypothetical protein
MQRVILVLAVVLMGAMVHAGEVGAPSFAFERERDPAARVLAWRDELGLTAEQVLSLDAIRAKYRALNEPLLAQLRELMPDETAMNAHGVASSPAEREALRQRMVERRSGRGVVHGSARTEHLQAARPLVAELRENQRQAQAEVEAVLTTDQQAQWQTLEAQHEEALRRQMRDYIRQHRGAAAIWVA